MFAPAGPVFPDQSVKLASVIASPTPVFTAGAVLMNWQVTPVTALPATLALDVKAVSMNVSPTPVSMGRRVSTETEATSACVYPVMKG